MYKLLLENDDVEGKDIQEAFRRGSKGHNA